LGVENSRLPIWNVKDPWGGNPAEYDRAALEIRQRLAEFCRAEGISL
jgi:protein-tyrosine-phosphatase